MKNDLFNETLLKKYSANFKITHKQKEIVREYVEMIEKREFKGETQNYLNFYDMIIKDILGYERANVNFDQKVDDGAGRSEFVLKSGNKKFMVVELKGQGTDLDKKQTRQSDTRTPVDQAFGYAIHTGDVEWILLSNYNELRLYNYHEKTKYISFNAEELADNEKLKEFLVVFSKESLIDSNYIDKVHHETQIVERKLENEFYKLYNETRLMLIKELEEHKGFDRIKAVHYAQLILNRYMFICFAEDIDLLPSQISISAITEPIKLKKAKRNSIWYSLNDLFLDIYDSNPEKDIFDYNGGQFKEDIGFIQINDFMEDKNFFKDTLQYWKFEDYSIDIESLITPYNDKINPIYKNLLTISSFDFSSDLDVNILGHIFENSIGDLEELKEDAKGRRKKEGIFYTPNYITDYIYRNTIIPYLSKSGNSKTVPELIQEYSLGQEIETLESNLMNIKIVDMACGSGAFLNKASDILLEIHKSIYEFKKREYTSTIETKGGKGKDKVKRTATHVKLDSFFDEISARRTILINNIYGVDLNEESVEITKLALFLKVCQKDKKLPEIENNIKNGNSLIDTSNFTDKPLKWEKEFKDIFENGGFDIVIGNPPYVRNTDLTIKDKNYFKSSYKSAYKQYDIYVLFFELGLKILKNNGHLGFITSNKFLATEYGKNLRDLLLQGSRINSLIDVSYLRIFKDASTYPVILLLQKELNKSNREDNDIIFQNIENINDLNNNFNIKNVKQSEYSSKGDNRLLDILASPEFKIINKIDSGSVKLKKIFKCQRGSPKNKLKLVNEKIDYSKACIRSKNIDKYTYTLSEDIFVISNLQDKILLKEKILLPRTVLTFKATYDAGGNFIMDRIYYLMPKTEVTNVNLKYITLILNSKVIDFYYKINFGTTHIGGGYLDLKGTQIVELPIKIISGDIEKQFIEQADKMLRLNRDLMDEINSFKRWLQNRYGVKKFSKKLENYYELTVNDFMNELKKKKVDTDALKNHKNLEKGFNESITVINPLLRQITETDSEIDQMVYELYGLNNEETEIIEDSLNSEGG